MLEDLENINLDEQLVGSRALVKRSDGFEELVTPDQIIRARQIFPDFDHTGGWLFGRTPAGYNLEVLLDSDQGLVRRIATATHRGWERLEVEEVVGIKDQDPRQLATRSYQKKNFVDGYDNPLRFLDSYNFEMYLRRHPHMSVSFYHPNETIHYGTVLHDQKLSVSCHYYSFKDPSYPIKAYALWQIGDPKEAQTKPIIPDSLDTFYILDNPVRVEGEFSYDSAKMLEHHFDMATLKGYWYGGIEKGQIMQPEADYPCEFETTPTGVIFRRIGVSEVVEFKLPYLTNFRGLMKLMFSDGLDWLKVRDELPVDYQVRR